MNDTINLTCSCPFCGKSHSITVNIDEYETGMAAIKNGALIQNAFPNWTPDQRELVKTGICPTCWDSI